MFTFLQQVLLELNCYEERVCREIQDTFQSAVRFTEHAIIMALTGVDPQFWCTTLSMLTPILAYKNQYVDPKLWCTTVSMLTQNPDLPQSAC